MGFQDDVSMEAAKKCKDLNEAVLYIVTQQANNMKIQSSKPSPKPESSSNATLQELLIVMFNDIAHNKYGNKGRSTNQRVCAQIAFSNAVVSFYNT